MKIQTNFDVCQEKHNCKMSAVRMDASDLYLEQRQDKMNGCELIIKVSEWYERITLGQFVSRKLMRIELWIKYVKIRE